jgi:SAM-dependent methyltransferase
MYQRLGDHLQLAITPGLPVAWQDVERRVADSDAMYDGNAAHYFGVGLSALSNIHASMALAGMEAPRDILDFGSGCGRVTRWLRAAWPTSRITAAERTSDQTDCCAALFGAVPWLTTGEVGAGEAPGRYDLIWAGSVLTHLPMPHSVALLQAFLRWIRPGGLIVATTHGRRALHNVETGHIRYIEPEAWTGIVEGYRQTGYGYADYVGQTNYGISVTSIDWIARNVRRAPDSRLLVLAEAAWDNHQDVFALQAQRP